MLDRARWQRISRLLDEALELDNAEREAWLARVRGAEPELAGDVAALLDEHRAAQLDGFLEGTAAPLAAPPMLEGRRLGAYTLRAPIGQGGMGSVWRAERSDGKYEAAVAIKLLNLALIGGAGVARFRREGSILARLQHPHIAHLLDAGVSDDGQPYLVLELVEGEAIDAYCNRLRLGVDERLRLFLDVLAAVGHAHTHLVIHRDLKPANVLVMGDGQVKLLDFGIAKLLEPDAPVAGADAAALTQEGTRALTPRYAAPEQMQGGAITTATDVFALGVMLYELLGGRHPSGGAHASTAELMRATLDVEPVRLSQTIDPGVQEAPGDLERIAAARATSPASLRRRLKGDLDNIVARALRKAPTQRYATVAAFADDLQRHLAHEPVSARPDTLRYRAGTFVRRHRGAVFSAGLTLAGLVAAVVLTTWQMLEARAQREEARTQAAKAEASRRFLNLLLTDVGADGAPLTPAQLIDRGAHLLDAQYATNSKFVVDQLIQLASGYEEIDQPAKVHEVLLRAESLAKALGDDERLAEAECSLVPNELLRGDRERARTAHDAAHAALARLKRPLPILRADCLQADAQFAKAGGNSREAATLLNQVLTLLESTGNADHPSYVATLTKLASLHNELGEPVPSFDFNRRAGAVLDKNGRGGSMSRIIVLNNEAAALFGFGETRRAAEVQGELLKRVDARGANPNSKVSFTANYGGILTALGKPDEAIPVLRETIVVARASKNTFWEQRASFQLARALIRSGRWAEGERQLDEAEAAYRRDEVMNKPYLRYVAAVRAELLLGQGRAAEAKATIDALLRDLGYPRQVKALQLVSALPLAAEIDLALNDAAAAEPMAAAAVELAGKVARDPLESGDLGKAWLELGRVRARRGDVAGARTALTNAVPSLANGLGGDNALSEEARTRLAALGS